MSDAIKGNRRLVLLSQYNRSVGLPSLLFASLTAALIVGVSIQDGLSPLLTALAQAMLIFMVVDSALILGNLLVMSSYLKHLLGSLAKRGLPYGSLSGVEAIQDTLVKEMWYALVLLASSVLSLTMYMLGVLGIVTFIYISLTSSLITFGFAVIKRRSALDPEEMLEIYEPDIYPVVIGSDSLLETFIDPFHWLKFDEYKREIAAHLKDGLSVGDALSKITFLLYQNTLGALTEEAASKEAAEMFEGGDFSKVRNHESFSFATLKIIVSKMARLVPELTRLIDRLFLTVADNLPELKRSDVVIDAEASWEKRRGQTCNTFILLYNNHEDKTQRLSVTYNAPSFSPSSGEVSITLPPRDFSLPDADALPVYSEGKDDVTGLMSKLMDNTRFVWFSFETKETGTKPVVITVKDRETGNTLFGKTFIVEASYDMSGLMLKMVTTLSVLLGVVISSQNFLKSFIKF